MSALRRPARRGCLLSLLIAVVLLVAIVLLVRRALDLDPLRSRLEARLSEAMGQPVSIGRLGLSLLPVPALEAAGITVPSPSSREPAVRIDRATIRPQLSSLFSDIVVIEQVRLTGLVVRAVRLADGTWVLPRVALAPAASSSALVVAGKSVEVRTVGVEDGRLLVVREGSAPGPREASIDSIQARMLPADGAVALESVSGRLGSSLIAGSGSASPESIRLTLAWTALSPSDLPAVFALLGASVPEGLAIDGDRPVSADLLIGADGRLRASGEVAASAFRFGALAIESVAGTLRYVNQLLTVEGMSFTAYGGTGQGSVGATLSASPLVWTMDASVENADVNRFLGEAASTPNRVSGRARLGLRLKGPARAPLLRLARGTVDLRVRHGAIHQFPLLDAIGRALGVEMGDDDDLRFEELAGTFTVADAVATTDDLQLRHAHARVDAAGRIGLDQSLDLRGTVAFSRARSQQAIRRVRELAGLRNAQGEIEVPVRMTGTLTDPAFAVDVQSIVQDAAGRELRRRLDRVLQGLIKKK
ncbi:MAG TPA: AsmA-like C-terminal region-containing protein [Vicinamibacterales bacterium]|nr:AsmA-like C-terminal region-containing protein [Vicinamibacterales bacterium]